VANRIPSRGEFPYPTNAILTHEWISDSLIDNGKNCKLVYPQKDEECSNCYLDVDTGKSTSIYKAGGPISFTNYTICPHCQGEGRLYTAEEETIKCRIYYNSKYFMSVENYVRQNNVKIEDDVVQIVTYMTNVSKIERAQYLIADSDIRTIKQYRFDVTLYNCGKGLGKKRFVIKCLR
jgi:hypothetical protein